jgi:hypothetical protein
MLRSTLTATTLLLATAGLGIGTTSASADAPDRYATVDQVHETWGTCASGDDLVGDWTITQSTTIFSTGRGTLHLRAVGTVTRTGTGVVAKYSEKQRDFEFVGGSVRVVGLLAHLVVPGNEGFTVAGQARIGPDGTLMSVTPGLDELFELEDSLVQVVCDALAG